MKQQRNTIFSLVAGKLQVICVTGNTREEM